MTDLLKEATPMKGWHIDGTDVFVQNWGTDESLTVEETERRLNDYERLLQVERAAKDVAKDMSQYAEGLRMDANVGRAGASQLNAIAGWIGYKLAALRRLEGG